MKKTIILLIALLIMVFASQNVYAEMIAGNITIRYPSTNVYESSSTSGVILNVSMNWTTATNITNMTFIFTNGGNSTRFSNTTVNGTGQNTGAAKGDFTYNLGLGNLSEGIYTVVAEAHNETDNTGSSSNRINSSSVIFTIDRTNPSVSISSPYSGSSVLPSGGNIITFDYTPKDSNFGNCSLFLNNQLEARATSNVAGSNVTNNAVNRLTRIFNNDNNSVRVAVNCIDLSGLRTSSNSLNNFTFNVLATGFTPAQKQAIAAEASGSGGGGSPQASQQSSGFTAAAQNTANTVKTSFQQWAWAWIIGIVIVFGLIIKKLKK